jgi:hypothetical protein
MSSLQPTPDLPAVLPSSAGQFVPSPTVMTEDELIRFLRIPEISNATNHKHGNRHVKGTHVGAKFGPTYLCYLYSHVTLSCICQP